MTPEKMTEISEYLESTETFMPDYFKVGDRFVVEPYRPMDENSHFFLLNNNYTEEQLEQGKMLDDVYCGKNGTWVDDDVIEVLWEQFKAEHTKYIVIWEDNGMDLFTGSEAECKAYIQGRVDATVTEKVEDYGIYPDK